MSARAPINAPSTNIKSLLEDQVFSLYYCLDSEQLAEQYPPLNNSQDYYYKLQMCSSIKEALDSLINGYMIVLNVYNDDGYFKGEIQATSGSFKGSINCGNGNFVVDNNGSLQSKGGIRIYNDIVAWNGTSCFKNSANEFLIQQGSENNPVVRFQITKDMTYMIADNMNIYGGKINIGHSDSTNVYSDFVINADGSIDINNNELRTKSIILRYPTNDFIYGYNIEKTLALKIAGITYYTDGGHTTDFGNNLIGTNIYGNQVKLIGQTPTGKGNIYIDGASIYMTTISGGVYSNGSLIATSDKRVKKDISSFDKRYENFFMSLSPSIYKFINGTSDRYHSGFISQEIEEALVDNGLTTKDFAGFIRYNDPETNEEKYALRYEEFIALNTHMIQKLYKHIEELEKCIDNN